MHPWIFLIGVHRIFIFDMLKLISLLIRHNLLNCFSVFLIDQEIQICHLPILWFRIKSPHNPAFQWQYTHLIIRKSLKQAFSFFSLNSTHNHTGTVIILPCLHDFFVFLACDLFCRIVCHTGKIVFLCCQKQAFHGNLFRLWLRFPLFKDRTDQLDEIFSCKNFFLFLLLFLFFCFYV